VTWFIDASQSDGSAPESFPSHSWTKLYNARPFPRTLCAFSERANKRFLITFSPLACPQALKKVVQTSEAPTAYDAFDIATCARALSSFFRILLSFFLLSSPRPSTELHNLRTRARPDKLIIITLRRLE
jgi:hypothetical protein